VLLGDRNEYYDVLNARRQVDLQALQYGSMFKQDPETILNNLEKYPAELDTSTALGMSILGIPPEFQAVAEIAQESKTSKIYNEAKLWKQLQQEFQYDHVEDNMKMSFGDLLTGGFMPGGAKPGDVQYGVWAFAALDAFFQTVGPSGKWSVLASAANAVSPGQPMKVGRSQAYLRDLREYDKLLEKGYTSQKAQNMLQIDLSGTQVQGLGQKLGTLEELKQQIDMVQEAHKMGGEPVLAAMFRAVANGEPLNFDRATGITLESVKAEKTPYYVKLTNEYGMSPDEARDFIYKNIGTPLAGQYDAQTGESRYAFNEDGEISYTSSYNPNKVNFYAGRARQRFFWAGQSQQDYYRPEWADRDLLLEYSPGRVTAAEVFAPGSKSFDILSGLTDASYQLVPELFAGKGVKGVKNLQKGLRRVNPLMEAIDQGTVTKKAGSLRRVKLDSKSLADNVLDEVGPIIDGATGDGNLSKVTDSVGRLITNKNTVKDISQTKKAFKKLKKENSLFGAVPRFYQTTKQDILNQPTNVEFFKAIADEDNLYLLNTNPITKHLPAQVKSDLTEIKDWQKVQNVFDQMISTGYNIINDVGQNVPYTIPGKILPKTGSLTINKFLQSSGINPNASYRTFGSWAGEKARKVREGAFPLRRKNKNPQKLVEVGREAVIDTMESVADKASVLAKLENVTPDYALEAMGKLDLPKFEKYLGFSSNFNSSYNPYYRKLLGVVPDMGIPLNNLNVGLKQLTSHLQINGYDVETGNKILKEFMEINPLDKTAYRDFAFNQASRDLKLVRAKGGNSEYIADHAAEMFEGLKKMKIYSTDADKNILPNIGSNYRGHELNELGNAVDDIGEVVTTMSGSLFSEMQDNIAPLMDYRLIERAVGPLFKAYPDNQFKATTILTDTKKYAKYKTQHFSWNKADDAIPNPFDDGILNVKRLENNFVSNLMSFYTRNLFKPLVLMRAAFFTRVFMEEQARIAVKGLSSVYNRPYEYFQWLAAHNPNSRAGRMLEKLPFTKYKAAQYNPDAVDFLMQEEVIEAMQKTMRYEDIAGGANKTKNNKYIEYKGVSTGELTESQIVESVYHELRLLRGDPMGQAVAKFGYGSDELTAWLTTPAGKEARLQFVRYKGRKAANFIDEKSKDLDQHLQFLESRIRIIAGGSYKKGKDSRINNKTRKYTYNITTTDLGNQSIRNMIADGQLVKYGKTGSNKKDIVEFFSNEDVFLRQFKKSKVTDELAKYYNKTDGIDPGTLTQVVDKAEQMTPQNFLGQVEDMMNNGYQAIFDRLMTKPIGYLNRSTTFKQFRWMYIQDRFEDFSKPLRKQFINEAKEAGVPKDIIDEMVGLDKLFKPGQISNYEVMNTESKAYALSGVKELLYDTKQRHTVSDKLVNIFPFIEVWFEVFQTWGQLLNENPYVLRKAHLGIRGGGAADALGSSSEDGFISPDPMSPERNVFIMPFGGFMSNLIFDDELTDGEQNVQISPRSQVQGVNLLAQGFVPGPNSLVAFSMARVLPRVEDASTKLGAKYGWANEFEQFFFGAFPPPDKVSDVFAASPVYKKGRAMLMDPDKFDYITDNSTEIEQMRAKKTIDIYRWGVSAGESKRLYEAGKLDKYMDKLYPNMAKGNLNEGQIDNLYLEYAKEKSGTLFAFEFIYQFFGPTGFKPEFFVEDNQGHLWGQATLYEEYIRIREENAGNDIATYNEFFETYGIEHPYMLSPRSKSETGKQSTSVRVQNFQRNNPEIFNNLKISGYYLNIDNPYEEKNWNDIVAEKSLLSPDQYRRAVNDTLGFFRYKTYSKKIDELQSLTSVQKTIFKRAFRNELKLALPGFQSEEYGITNPPTSKDIFAEMKAEWLTNPAVLQTDAGKGFAEIMNAWTYASTLSAGYSTSGNEEWWLTSDDARAKALRIYVYNDANRIIKQYPEFWGVWTGVMLKLYRDDQEVLDYFPQG